MEEYHNIQYSDIQLYKKDDTTLLCKYKKKKYISFTSPPLLCKSVLQKENSISLVLETTENNWNFENTLSNISKQCKKNIRQNSKKWYNIEYVRRIETDYISLCDYSRTKTHYDNTIIVPIHKKYSNTLSKKTLKSFKNNTIILRFIFYKIVLCDEEFIEKWAVDNISLSIPDYDDELSDDFDKDIGEEMFITNVQYTDDENQEEEIKKEPEPEPEPEQEQEPEPEQEPELEQEQEHIAEPEQEQEHIAEPEPELISEPEPEQEPEQEPELEKKKNTPKVRKVFRFRKRR